MQQRVRAFDYLVVGSGAAGCIVAARLAATGVSVGLIEAGKGQPAILRIPLASLWSSLRFPSRFCWMDVTTPQAALNRRRLEWPAGRLVGGSTAINAMMYCRGHRASYDRWQLGRDPDWSFDALLPYFKRAQHQERGANAWHGIGGPIAVSDSRFTNRLTDAFLQGCDEVGLAATDFNDPDAIGAGRLQVTQRNGERSSSAAYLNLPESRSVQLFVNTAVRRLVIEHGRAVGVVCQGVAEPFTIRAEREVILCAGVIRSPQLLMLSGIGPAHALSGLGIEVIADRPSVGDNLRDHLRVPTIRSLRRRGATRELRMLLGCVPYFLRRRGAWTSNVCDVAAVVQLYDADVPRIRIVFHWWARSNRTGPCVGFEVALIDPASSGRMHLLSSDPRAATAIDPGYLSAPIDTASLVRGVEMARAIAATPACRSAGIGEEVARAAGDPVSEIRAGAETAFHPVGTCRMGSDPDAVVDPWLRVHGVRQLRVVDASVMPTTVAGNAQAAVIAIAERASDLILGSN